MLRGYRLIILAIAGLILLGTSNPSDNRASDSAATETGEKARQHENVSAGISRIGNALETQNNKTDPYEEDRTKREIRDLQAQENSAYWAEAMFWATVVALAISFVGISLVWTTFRETQKANKIAHDTMRHQFRAHMVVDSFYWNGNPNEGAQFGVLWKNAGGTPTIKLRTFTHYILSDNPLQDNFDFPVESEWVRPAHAGPGSRPFMSPPAPKNRSISPGDIRAANAGSKHLYVYGCAWYYDVFDPHTEHVTKFCCKPRVQTNPEGMEDFVFGMHDWHNCADEGCDGCK